MKEGVVSCDSWSVAASVESAMFERLGSFEAPQKANTDRFFSTLETAAIQISGGKC